MIFELKGDHENSIAMAQYMKNHFPFLGVSAPERRKQTKELLKKSKTLPVPELIGFITEMYRRKEREYQYVAIDMALANVSRLTMKELPLLTALLEEKAWWDSVDAWRKLYGKYVFAHLDEKEEVFRLFYQHPNFWLRRVGINLQLMEQETLNVQLLTKAIEADLHTDEFFIQKAIGWSLRQYSKYDPKWVQTFIDMHDLSPLAQREGSKHLPR